MYRDRSLNIIQDSNILTNSDFETINNIKDELEDVFRHSQIFRTRTEMEVSILNDIHFPTPDAKYWQAVREQNVMFQELVMLSYEYRKNQVEIKKLERSAENEDDELEQELLRIEIERKKFIALNQERTAKDRIREIKEWHEIKQGLFSSIRYSFTDVNEHQLSSYTQKWINQLITSGDSGSIPERSNLLSQLDMGLKKCREKGILKEVLSKYDLAIVNDLKNIFWSEGGLEEWLLPNISQPQLQSEKVL